MTPNPLVRWSLCLVAAAAVPLAAACAGPAPTATPTATAQAQSPDAVARAFYGWYVGLMAHDREASDEPQPYRGYVAAALRARIQRAIESPDGIDADYFTKTQDYDDGWIGHVAVSPAKVSGASARTVVTLGTGAKAWRLAVTLVREEGRWKLGEVRRG